MVLVNAFKNLTRPHSAPPQFIAITPFIAQHIARKQAVSFSFLRKDWDALDLEDSHDFLSCFLSPTTLAYIT
jgi:hypothetical protein